MGEGKPRLLDLFCKEGGAAKGYADAGFEVVGVDIEPQPNYPFKFWQGDALRVLEIMQSGGGLQAGFYGIKWSAIHASPPCQKFSKAQRLRGVEHPDLIAPIRMRLEATGLPYVIENVEDARAELTDPVTLCGTMFGLRLYRHRLFETNWPLGVPLHGEHHLPQVKLGRRPQPGEMLQPVGNFSGVAEAREAMEMPWASRDGLREAIPPAYTEHIGQYLMAHLTAEQAA